MKESVYDFVIVGGGSAGCVLANRLSSDPTNRVLVIEAGRPDHSWDLLIQMPGAMLFPIGNRFYDWRYETNPEPHLVNRRISHARGKILGGSSSINGMVFQRGNPLDYERWSLEPGMKHWDYAHCLPYFKRLETHPDGPSEYRGDGGPLILEKAPAKHPLSEAFLAAAVQDGHTLSNDLNGRRQEGFAAMDRNIHRGQRQSASRAYLRPAMHRPNLDVLTRALVGKVVIENNRAIAVDYLHHGQQKRAKTGEVILCGGAFNTPQLMQLSGLGDGDELATVGIDVKSHLPGVGENLQDHLEVYVQHACKQPVSISAGLLWRNRPRIGLEWLLSRQGIGSTNHLEVGGFVRTSDAVEYPNLMFHFLPIAIGLDGSSPVDHGYQAHITPTLSNARGSVKVTSSRPTAKPAIQFNYLSTENDRKEWVAALRTARRILSQTSFDAFDAGELSPGPEIETDEGLLQWVARTAETSLHPVGTCKMCDDDWAVVDPSTMGVHGVKGLRIVDASVMPLITNGNTYAPVIMIAERAADLIVGNTPLPPESVDFYRHESSADVGSHKAQPVT